MKTIIDFQPDPVRFFTGFGVALAVLVLDWIWLTLSQAYRIYPRPVVGLRSRICLVLVYDILVATVAGFTEPDSVSAATFTGIMLALLVYGTFNLTISAICPDYKLGSALTLGLLDTGVGVVIYTVLFNVVYLARN